MRMHVARLFGNIYGKDVVLSFGFVLSPGTSADVLVWGGEGPQRAQGHFKDDEGVPIIIVLLIVQCLWEGAGVDTFLWPQRVLVSGAILGGGKNQDVPGVHE